MTTVTAIAVTGFMLSAGYVLRAISRSESYRRRGEPLPVAFAGNVAGGLATMFLFGSVLASDYVGLRWACGIAAVVCLSVDWRQTRAALRRSEG